jgi:hypothetical protein
VETCLRNQFCGQPLSIRQIGKKRLTGSEFDAPVTCLT